MHSRQVTAWFCVCALLMQYCGVVKFFHMQDHVAAHFAEVREVVSDGEVEGWYDCELDTQAKQVCHICEQLTLLRTQIVSSTTSALPTFDSVINNIWISKELCISQYSLRANGRGPPLA